MGSRSIVSHVPFALPAPVGYRGRKVSVVVHRVMATQACTIVDAHTWTLHHLSHSCARKCLSFAFPTKARGHRNVERFDRLHSNVSAFHAYILRNKFLMLTSSSSAHLV